MSLLGSIARKNLSLTDEKAWNPSLWNLVGSQSLSGEKVTEETALTYSPFWNAVSLISGTVASLPLYTMRERGRNKERAKDLPIYSLLHTSPNPYMTAMAFREVMMAHILTWGNGYAEKVPNRLQDIVELWPIPPNKVKSIEMSPEGELVYGIDVGGEIKYLKRDRILHIPGLGFDGFIGYSVVAMARKSLGLAMAMETFGSTYFGQGTHPGVIVTHPGKLNAQSSSNMRQALTETYSGLGQTHRLMLLEEGMKIEKIGVPPNDSQFLESRQFQIPEVARWFNLPPHKLKDLTKSSFNNIESEQISFVTDSILPWLIRLEQNYYMQLLSEREKRQGNLYFKHVVEGLLRANSKDRSAFYKDMIGSTIMTPNEAREKEDMNPSDDPLADQLFVNAAYIPLSKLAEYLSSQKESTTGGEAPAGNDSGNDDDDDQDDVVAAKVLTIGRK